MKRFFYFVKRRFCPVMLALLVMFFSAVIPVLKVEASPAPVLPPTFEVIPGGAPSGLTYFDLYSSIFGATGIDVKMADGKSFDQELWEEICDTFDIWAEQNISDFKELGAELSGLVSDAVDGTINMSKKLFEALQKYGKEAAEWVKLHTAGDSDLSPDKLGYVSLGYIDSITGNSLSKYYNRTDQLYIIQNFLATQRFKHFILVRNSFSSDDTVYDTYRLYLFGSLSYYYYDPNNGVYWAVDGQGDSCVIRNAKSGSRLVYFGVDGSYISSSVAGLLLFDYLTPYDHFVATNMNEIAVPSSPSDPVTPVQPPYPVHHIVFTPRPAPVTWPDYVAKVVPDANPDSLPDSAPVPVPHRNPATGDIIDPDPDPIPIPDPVPVPDPDPEPDPEPDPDADEKVDPEQIAGLPDKITAAGDITKLFPFCIPFDIIALVKSMKAEKAPPVWHFEFYFDQINYKFEVTVDMTQYEGYVKIFRSGFVILYIITLMLLTVRYSSGIAKD